MSRRSRRKSFRIQDINETVSGDLHVKVKNKAGQVQEYDVSTAASIPFLARRRVRYKLAAGRPQDWDHNMEGGFFTSAEASRGSLTAGRCTAAPSVSRIIGRWR